MMRTYTVDQQRLSAVDRLLAQRYRRRQPAQRQDPLDELIATILSQSTTDRNSGRAFRALRDRFPDWADVLAASQEEVAATIRSAGLGTIKARRIQLALAAVLAQYDELSLDSLAQLSSADAMRQLTAIDGVGPKTAACVLLFALGRPAMPVDTHVHRVTRRLGVISASASAARAQELLEAAVPDERKYDLHLNLIQHGRTVCTAQNPRCTLCDLSECCVTYSASQLTAEAPI